MIPTALTLATLSLLVLAAHFLRGGDWLTPLCLLACVAMLFLQRQRWVARITQVLLAMGAFVWIGTAMETYQRRVAEGGDPRRLVMILAVVILVDVVAAILLGAPAVLARYPSASAAPKADPPAA